MGSTTGPIDAKARSALRKAESVAGRLCGRETCGCHVPRPAGPGTMGTTWESHGNNMGISDLVGGLEDFIFS